MKRESSKLFRLDLAIREAGIGRGVCVGRIERGGGGRGRKTEHS